MKTTPEQRAELWRLEADATPAPWEVAEQEDGAVSIEPNVAWLDDGHRGVLSDLAVAVAARNALPALLDDVAVLGEWLSEAIAAHGAAQTDAEAERDAAIARAERAEAALTEVRAQRDSMPAQILDRCRGIQGEPCKGCGGWGVKAYGSTATWRGGIGGQVITDGVCNRCWGSGDAAKPWPSWRRAEQIEAQLDAARARAEKVEDALKFIRDLRGSPATGLTARDVLLAVRERAAAALEREARHD